MNKALSIALTILILLASCGCKRTTVQGDNPLLSEKWENMYGVPPWISIQEVHLVPGIRAGIEAQQAALDSIAADDGTTSFANVIEPFARSGRLLNRNISIVRVLSRINETEQTNKAAAETASMLAVHYGNIYHNAKLFARIEQVHGRRYESGLEAEQIGLTEIVYNRFVTNGALLDEAGKSRLREIDIKLAELGVGFSENVRRETNGFNLVISEREEITGLPNIYITNAAQEAQRTGYKDKWMFTLKNSSRLPFLTYSENATYRSDIYGAFVSRGNNDNEYDNKGIIDEIASLRLEKARILGYQTYAGYRLAGSVYPDPESARSFIDKIWLAAKERADEILTELADAVPGGDATSPVLPWDYWRAKNWLSRTTYGIPPESLALYFTLDNVVSGVLALSNRLWGITIRPVPAEVYSTDWSAYEVRDIDNSLLGIIYLDMVSRPGKQDGLWCIPVISQSYDDTTRISPVVVMGADFAAPNTGSPTTLTLQQTKQCFGLFGMALSYILSDVKYGDISLDDPAQMYLPALIMQKWALHPEMLQKYAKKDRTNEPLSERVIGLIQRNRSHESIPPLTSSIASAYLDLSVHGISSPLSVAPDDLENSVLTEAGIPSAITPDYKLTYFEPVFSGNEAAVYHRYLQADIMASDAFDAFIESGDIFDRRIAISLRENVFSKGGAVSAVQKHLNFRGTMPDITPFMINVGLKERPRNQEEPDNIQETIFDTDAAELPE